MRKGNREHVLVHIRVPKSEANYTEPASTTDKCGECEYFEKKEKNHCTRVEGQIKSSATCDLFEEKE